MVSIKSCAADFPQTPSSVGKGIAKRENSDRLLTLGQKLCFDIFIKGLREHISRMFRCHNPGPFSDALLGHCKPLLSHLKPPQVTQNVGPEGAKRGFSSLLLSPRRPLDLSPKNVIL